jgi:hypothetical protein
LDGVIAIDARAGVTVKVVDPLIEPEVAVRVVDPAATPVASPLVVMVAAAGFDELQVAELVRLPVVPFEYVPVAVNCCMPPTGTDGLEGVTVIETKVGVDTVSAADPATAPEVAVIVDVPAPTPVANPAELMVATLVSEEVQTAEFVRFAVVPLA